MNKPTMFMRLRDRWTSALVRRTARVFAKKERLAASRGVAFAWLLLGLIKDEIIVCVLALPLFVIGSADAQKHAYQPVFRIRHVLVRSIILLLTAVWIVKGVLVVVRLSALRTAPFSVEQVGTTAVPLPPQPRTQSVLPPVLLPPLIEEVVVEHRTVYRVRGRSSAESIVHIFIEERGSHRTLVARVKTDTDGLWAFEPTNAGQFGLSLPAGDYLFSAVAEDEYRGLRSVPSPTRVWAATPSPLDYIDSYGSAIINSIMIIGVLGALAVTLLTLS